MKNTHDKFSLYILEYCEIENLITREQFYFDLLKPPYNILKIAGSSLGYTHTLESLSKISIAKTGTNHTEETKTKISESLKGPKNPMFGKIGEESPNYNIKRTSETLIKMSESMKGKMTGENHPMFGKVGADSPFYGKTHTPETLAKISEAKGTTVYLYDSDGTTLINTFSSIKKVTEHFKASKIQLDVI